jgi:hypothetical protein
MARTRSNREFWFIPTPWTKYALDTIASTKSAKHVRRTDVSASSLAKTFMRKLRAQSARTWTPFQNAMYPPMFFAASFGAG